MKTGKSLLIFTLLFLAIAVIFLACGGGGGDGDVDNSKFYGDFALSVTTDSCKLEEGIITIGGDESRRNEDDYLYIPLGGSRHGAGRTYFNLFVVFFLCGLWHGASWTFVLWGIFHGCFIVIEKIGFSRVLEQLWWPLRHFYLLIVVLVSWVLFRSETIGYAGSYLAQMFGGTSGVMIVHTLINYLTLPLQLAVVAGALFSMPFYLKLKTYTQTLEDTVIPIAFSKIVAYFSLFALSVMSLASGAYNPFIYFRF